MTGKSTVEKEKTPKPKKPHHFWRIALILFGLVYFSAVALSFYVLKYYILCALSALGGFILILDFVLELSKVKLGHKSVKVVRYFEGAIFLGVGIAYLLYFLEII